MPKQFVKVPVKRFNRMKWMTVTIFAMLIFVSVLLFMSLVKLVQQKENLDYCVSAYNGLSLKYFDKQTDLVWHFDTNNTQYKCSALLCQNEKVNDCSDIKLSCLSCCLEEENKTNDRNNR